MSSQDMALCACSNGEMLRFGSVQIDIDARQVQVAGSVQHLEPQAFDLLAYLVAHRDRVVPKAELLEEVWGDQFVSDSALTTRIKEIRQTTGDDGRKQEVIQNVRGRGYRFVASQTGPDADRVTAEPHERVQRVVPPQPATPSVGLEPEIERLAELTIGRRLVTIVGPGGVGKTRLATEVGRIVAERHALGARVVELSRLGGTESIGPVIRRALDRTEMSDGLTDGLGAIDALLVLDNCEHVIDAVAEQVPALLAGGEALRILATSREPLGVPGEQRWSLAPLSTTGASAPALTLFVERARDVGTEIEATDPRARTIVSHLDGIPLALEMAAARLATMGLADLTNDLEQSVVSLRAGPRAIPERHSTLRAVLAWSEALLTPVQRSTLADFSVFAGPVEAADLVGAVDAPDAVGAVCDLAERSLVTIETTPEARARYGSLETVRQFSRERLHKKGRLEAVRRRHAVWFTEAAEAAAATYDTVDQGEAVSRIDAIFDELRSAHRWAREHEPSLAMRLSFALYQPAYQELRLEVFEWSMALAEVIESDDDQAARLYGEVALGLTLLGRIDEGRQWASRAMDAATDPLFVQAAFLAMADIHLYIGDLERSLEYGRRLDEIAAKTGTRIEIAVAKASLALPLAYLGRQQEALETIPTAPPDGAPPSAWAWLAYTRGEVLLDSDPQAALNELDTAIALAESVDGNLADRGNATHLLTTLRNLPTLFVRLDQFDSAAQILGGLSAATISPTYGEEADLLTAAEQAARTALGDHVFSTAHAQGATRTLDQTARFGTNTLNKLKSPSHN